MVRISKKRKKDDICMFSSFKPVEGFGNLPKPQYWAQILSYLSP
jgi:hypothetical protein